jgi:hypothetical protein
MTSEHKQERVTEHGYLTMTQAERYLGLSQGALATRLKAWGKLGLWTRKRGKYRVIHERYVERWAEMTTATGAPLVLRRPRGWLTIYQAAEHAGCSISLIWQAAKRGELEVVRRGQTHYYEPTGVERLRLSLGELPLPGWLEVTAYARARGADRYTVVEWLKRNSYALREFRRPQDRQRAWFARERALATWAKFYALRQETPGGRYLADARVRELLLARGVQLEPPDTGGGGVVQRAASPKGGARRALFRKGSASGRYAARVMTVLERHPEGLVTRELAQRCGGTLNRSLFDVVLFRLKKGGQLGQDDAGRWVLA